MEVAINRGQRIAYDVAGHHDDTVVLLPGLGTLRTDWADCGYVDGLSDSYRVISIDSLGHGDSDGPDECALYSPEQRAGDVRAVLDHAGVQSAHLVGYSMGGWIAMAVLLYAPGRVRSICSGGWDPVRGLAGIRATLGVDLDFDMVLGGFRAAYPELTAWITPDREPGLRCCFAALDDLNGVAAALETSDQPVLLWDGRDDAHHDSSLELAAQLSNAEFLETPGDHAGAFIDHAQEALIGLRAFLAAAAK